MSGRRAVGHGPGRRAGAVALMLLLVTWAASIGPDEVLRGEGNPPSYETRCRPRRPPTAAPSRPATRGRRQRRPRPPAHDRRRSSPSVLGAVVMLAVVLVGAALAAHPRLAAAPRASRSRRRSQFDPLDAPAQRRADAWWPGAGEQRAAARRGQPAQRDRRLLAPVRGAGRRRRASERQPWETSSEFTLRVLDRLVDADERRGVPPGRALPRGPLLRRTRSPRPTAPRPGRRSTRSTGRWATAGGVRRERRRFWWGWLAATAVVFAVVLGWCSPASTPTRDPARCCCWSRW